MSGSERIELPDNLPGRAVIYLRVSSIGQLNTDFDAEGFSIPAQREACLRKAEALGVTVLDEYVDKAESARSADRPGLQLMLGRLTELRDIDYVIVHKIDRLARNRADDVAINLAIREAGARLVSVTENIDESPSGTLLHGIMSSIAEFYSKNLANEITKGMGQKAKRGGHNGLAPIGYLNTRELTEGKEIRTITVDPDRAPLVRWAFEAYASGDYSISQLTEALAERGLRTRTTARQGGKPMTRSKVAKMLHNYFYVGIVTWSGVQHPGRHEPIVPVPLFAEVQALLESRDRATEKRRKHHHYLKGSLFCARCKERLSFSRSRGRNDVYDYFFCQGRHERRQDCTLPYIAPKTVEDAIDAHYSTIQLGEQAIETISTKLRTAMREQTKAAEQEARRQRRRVAQLEAERRKLLQAHLADAIPLDLLKDEQLRITKELANAGAALAQTELHWENIEHNLAQALELLRDPQALYRRLDGTGRRHLNQAIFEAIYIDEGGVSYTRLSDPFADLLADDLLTFLDADVKNPNLAAHGRGSRETRLVDLLGRYSNHGHTPLNGSTRLCVDRGLKAGITQERPNVEPNSRKHA